MVGWQRHLRSLVRQVGKTVEGNYTQYANFLSSSSSSSSPLEAGLPYLQRFCGRPYSPTIARPLHQYFQQLGISGSRNLLTEEATISSPSIPLLTSSTAKAEEHNQKSLTKPSIVRAVLKGIKQSPKKVNLVAALVRGMRVEDALLQLQVTVKGAAKLVYQVIHSARANATHNHGLDSDRLLVADAFVGKIYFKKRFSYHAKGKCGVKMRPKCQLTVVVREITPDEEADIAKLKVENFVKLTKRERRLVPHQLIETTSIWDRKGKGRNHEQNAGLPYLQRLCGRPYSPTIARPLHQYFQQLGISSSRNLLTEEAPISSPSSPLLTSSTAKAEEHNQKSLTKPSTVRAVLKGIKQGVRSHMCCRYYRSVRTSDCYFSREQGLLRPRYILIVRDVIRSCLERLERGVFTVSFINLKSNGFSYSLDDGTDPIIPELGNGDNGGLYLLLKNLLDFDGQDPMLAILFFSQLREVESAECLKRLLEDLFLKGVTERVRSIGLLYQCLSNFAPAGPVYRNAYDANIDYWEVSVNRVGKYTIGKIVVAECIKTIPIIRIKNALLAFHNRNPGIYSTDDIAACITCMRHGLEHCNQFSTSKRRVPNQLSMTEAIWGFNEAFHIVYPSTQTFLNVNPHLINLNLI